MEPFESTSQLNGEAFSNPLLMNFRLLLIESTERLVTSTALLPGWENEYLARKMAARKTK
jgi:hypothetical protein